MTDIEKAIDLFFRDEEIPEFEPCMTQEELRNLGGKIVKFEPKDAVFLGGYFEPYHDVRVYEKDGEYFHVYDYIGD